MIRTTVRLPEELFTEAQQLARATGRTFTDLLSAALRHELSRAAAPRAVCEPLPTYRGQGVRDGVQLTDNAALEELMDAN